MVERQQKLRSLLLFSRPVNSELKWNMQVKIESTIKGSNQKLLSRWSFMIFTSRERRRLRKVAIIMNSSETEDNGKRCLARLISQPDNYIDKNVLRYRPQFLFVSASNYRSVFSANIADNQAFLSTNVSLTCQAFSATKALSMKEKFDVHEILINFSLILCAIKSCNYFDMRVITSSTWVDLSL